MWLPNKSDTQLNELSVCEISVTDRGREFTGRWMNHFHFKKSESFGIFPITYEPRMG